ncbi:MAG TPA: hypothetical protein VHC49_27625 [Mycobacteriales bacterium]|nr:hypothetical protein [Mycobacteriales bacterium]
MAGGVTVLVLCTEFAPYGGLWSIPALIGLVAVFRMMRRRGRAGTVPDTRDRTTAEIGEAWILTSLLLARSPSRSDRLHLCQVRDAYLSALSERDPEGFQRWVTDSLAGIDCRPDCYIRAETRTDDAGVNSWPRILWQHVSRGHFHDRHVRH